MKRILFSMLLAASTIAVNAQSSLKVPALSPNAKITQEFSISSMEISYSRPSIRGRKNIYGDLVPFGKAWRTGANAPTKIKIGEDLEMGGQKVKAGEYSLYTIPGKEKWEIILNTGEGAWTAEGFPKEFDVARFHIKPIFVDNACQTFTINVSDITFTTCKIELLWEKTKIVIPVTAYNAEQIESNIAKAIGHPTVPYFQAANYYFESGKKLDLAKSYVDKAVEQDPKASYMWVLKARIEQKIGNKDEAIASSKKAMELAKGTTNERDVVHNSQKVIDDINKSYGRRQIVD